MNRWKDAGEEIQNLNEIFEVWRLAHISVYWLQFYDRSMYSLKKIENASRRKEEGSERDKRHAELNSRDREKTGSRRCYEIKVAEQKQGVIRIIHHLYCIQVIWATYRELQCPLHQNVFASTQYIAFLIRSGIWSSIQPPRFLKI